MAARRRTRAQVGGLYSSLWLYLAGVKPVVFGARVEEAAEGEPASGDRVDFLVANAISRFSDVGHLVLPPAQMYAG